MGINVANVENKKILAYKLPSHYKKENNNIGNKLEDSQFFKYWVKVVMDL